MSTKKLQILGSLGTGSGSSVTIDPTFTQAGQAADAKATGDKFSSLETQINDMDTLIGDTSVADQISDAMDDYYTKSETDTFLDEKINKTDYLGPVVMEGNPIVYESGTEGLGIAAVSYLEPQQQGSGDPYPAGGGRNLLNYDMWKYIGVHNGTGVFENNGVTITANNDDAYTIDGIGWPDVESAYFAKIPINPGESITLSWEADRSYSANIYIFPNADIERLVVCNNNENRPLVYTATEGVSFVTIRFSATKAGDVASYRNIMVNKGTEALPFEPYSNIRPFIGYNALNLTAAGKNLLPNLATDGFYGGVSLTRNPDGTMYVQGTCTEEHVIPIWGNGFDKAIDIDDCWVTSRPGFGVKVIKADGSEAYYSYDAFYLAPGDSIVWAYFHFHPGEVWDGLVEPQIELGNQRTSYEPYQGKAYTVQIGQTVYGGKFDWLAGKLTDGIPPIEFDGDEVVSTDGGGIFTTSAFGEASAAYGEMWCSHYAVVHDYDTFMSTDMSVCVWASGQIRIHDSRFNSVSEINAEIAAQSAAGTPVQIAYKLANPIEIQLTPTQISELDGINTLYGDGSNIRAIFNTTSGPSSDVTAVKKTGDIMTGDLRIGQLDSTEGVYLRMQRLVGEDEYVSRFYTHGETGAASIQSMKGSTAVNYMYLKADETTFRQAVSINSGGTGAKNAADARANLGVLALSGGTLTGTLNIGSETNTSNNYFNINRTLNNIVHTTRVYNASTDGSACVSLINNESGSAETINRMRLSSTETSFMKPVNIAGGGTGATTAKQARENLGITPANIGAATTAQYNSLSSLVGDTAVSTQISNYAPSKTGSGASGNWGINVTGNAATATALTSSAGASSLPVYFSNGKPVAITHLWTSDSSSEERNVGAQSAAGRIYMYSAGSSNGNRGLFGSNSAGTSHAILTVDSNNNVTLNGIANAAATLTTTLPVNNGGTGATTAAQARTNLGITPANIGAATTAQFNNLTSLVGDTAVSTQISNYAPSKTGSGASGTWGINVTGSSGSCTGNAATATTLSATLAVNKGGTGSTTAAGARTNLGICGAITHGTGDPSGGSDGDIYFKHA